MELKHKKILLIPMIVLIIITLIAIVNVILHSTANADTNSTCNHVWKYSSITGEGKHKKTCEKCKISAVTEGCKYTDNIVQNGNSKTHTKVCDLCHGGLVQKCSPGAGTKRTKVPTCTTEGEVKVVCSICNGSWTEKIAKLDHTYVDGKCTKCGKNECTHKKEDGTSAYRVNGYGRTKGNYNTHEISIVCTICGDSKAKGRENHTFTFNMEDEKFECSKCRIVCPHDTFVDTDITKEATCKEDGQKRQQCTICKFYQLVPIPKISKHEYITKRVSATCTRDGSVTVECKYCGEKDSSRSYTIDALGHDYTRETSNYEKTPSRHARIYKCSRCNDTATKGSEEHIIVNGKDNGNGTHTGRCKICNYNVKQQNHEGGKHSNGGKCEICDAKYQNHSQMKEAFIYNKSATQHTPVYKCAYSGCTETYTGKAENHNKVNIKDNGDGTHSWNCSVCEYKTKENHTYQNGICTVCNARKREPLEHTHLYIMKFDANNHWYECTSCGATAENSKEAHKVITWKDNGDGTHKGNCEKCNYELKGTHTYENGSCTACKAKEKKPVCSHDYQMNSDGNKHWKQCAKCRDIDTSSIENHKVSTWKDNGDGTHKGNCEKCNYELKGTHTYENGSCTACKAKEKKPVCSHDYQMNSDGNKHWKQCTKCRDIDTSSIENHKTSTWKDNGDGTHKGNCTVCGKSMSEAHTKGTTGKCEKCSYDGTSSINNGNSGNNNSNNGNNNNGNSSGNNSGNNNNNTNNNNGNNSNNNSNGNNNNGNNSNKGNGLGDKTTATGKLPQTGVNNTVILTLITLGLGTTVFSVNKMKKIKA